jgi:parallel beta-helix repeat protein
MIKNRLLCLILTLFQCTWIAESQTIIPDKTEVSGVWTKAASPYIINGEAIVPAGLTLTIEPGVEVKLKTGTNINPDNGLDAGYLHVKGKLSAIGTASDTIIFTRNEASGSWGIIRFDAADPTSEMSYCKIQYANKIQYSSSSYEGAVFANSFVTVSNSLFSENLINGIEISGNAVISNNTISENNAGIYIWGGSPKVFSNKISNNQTGTYYRGYYVDADLLLTNNVFFRNSTAIYSGIRKPAGIFNNTFILNGVVISGNSSSGIQPVEITNCIFWRNTNIIQTNNDVKVTYCLIDVEIITGGQNNILSISIPVDTLTFSLPEKSPGKDNGTPDTTGLNLPLTDINNNPRIFNNRIDIGAVESQSEYVRIDYPFPQKALQKGKNHIISWNGTPTTYKLEYSFNNGTSWTDINSTVSAKSYEWLVPDTPSSQCKLKISSSTNASLFDTVSFRITSENIIINKEYVYGTWTKVNSPYIVEGEAIVPQGKTLNIEPGVEVRFNTGDVVYYTYPLDIKLGLLHVFGKISAGGTENDSIIFSRNGSSGSWGCIWFDNSSDTSIISGSRLEYGQEIRLQIDQSTIRSLQGVLSSFDSRYLTIEKSSIKNNFYGIYVYRTYGIIKGNDIYNNQEGGIYNYGYFTIQDNQVHNHLRTGILTRLSYAIIKNKIYENYEGISVSRCSPYIEGNMLYSNTIGIHGYGDYFSRCIIRNNTINNNETGINLYNLGTPTIVNNLIYRNITGIYLFHGLSGAAITNNTLVKNNTGLINNSASTSVTGNIIYFNKISFLNETSFSLKNSLVQDSSINTGIKDLGENLFAKDPVFVDTLNNNFALKINSPAINSGEIDTSGLFLPKTDFINNPRISNGLIDIGAYEYQQTGEYIRLFYPYNHEYFVSNTLDSITWLSPNTITAVDISYSTDAGKSWNAVAENIPNNGKYLWKTPELISESCKFRIVKHGDSGITDQSRYVFTISPNIIPDKKIIYGVWKKQYSPYRLLGDLIIPKDSVLTIDPGTIIKIKTGNGGKPFPNRVCGLISNHGKLIATGTSGEPIIFTREGIEGNWGGIYFHGDCSDLSTLKNCVVEYGQETNFISNFAETQGVIYCKESSPVFENCIIRNNSGTGIWAENSLPSIKNLTICSNTGHGIVSMYNQTNLNVSNSILYKNRQGSFLNPATIYPSYTLMEEQTINSSFIGNPGNIYGLYPQFTDSVSLDFHLQPNSPCIDAGNPADDFSLEPVPNGGRIDMGAYGNTPDATSFSPIPRFDSISKNKVSIFGGDTITISGKYFLPARGTGYVAVGDSTVLNYTVWNDTTIKLIAPSHIAGTYNFMIKAGNDLQNTLNNYFSYLNTQLTSIDPSYGKVEGGDTITIIGKYFSNGIRDVSLLFDTAPVTKVLSWTDTLIRVITSAHPEGLAGLVFNQSVSIKDTIQRAFLYTAKMVQEVCGNVSGTWAYPEIYLLTCPVTVPNGQKLIIEPGVTVYSKISDSGTLPKITVDGGLSAIGAKERNILFSVLPGIPGSWDGIMANDTTSLTNSIVEYATNGITVGTRIITIDSCIIRNNSSNGLFYSGDERSASGVLSNSTIENNGENGILCDAVCSESGGAASPEIKANYIRNNAKNGIELNAAGYVPSSGTATKSSSSSPIITGNTISGNYNYAISGNAEGESAESIQGPLMKRYAYVSPEIKNNIIYNNNGIINFYQGVEYSKTTANLINNTMYENSSSAIVSNGEVNVINSVLWGTTSQNVSVTGILNIDYSNTMPSYPGSGNISIDPQFINSADSDFHLKPTSPCINTGNPDTDGDGIDYKTDADDQDGDCTRKDIGALPYIYSPAKPVLAFPANNETGIPLNSNLTWYKATYAKQYRVNVSNTNLFSTIVINKTVSDTTLICSGLNYTSDYFWRVKAINIADSSDWSATWKFTTYPPKLVTTPDTVTIGRLGGSSGEFYIESNVDWSAIDDQNWLNISPPSGTNDETVTVSAFFDNSSTESRTATVTISGNEVTPQTVIVIQEGVPPVLIVSTNTLTIGATAYSTNTFIITSNISWTVESSENWLTINSNSGSGNATRILTAQANPTTATRTATITVSGTGVTAQKITVIQEGAAPVLNVSTSVLIIAAPAGSTNTFGITSTISWTISTDETWLTTSSVSGFGNATITVTATANPTISQRSANVTVSGPGVAEKTVKVTQDGAMPVLTVSANVLTIAAPVNSTQTFDITSNISWTAVSNQVWLTLNSGSGSGNTTIIMTATANPAISTRSATVTVSGSGVTAKTIAVTQAGAEPVLIVSTNALTISAPTSSTATFGITSNISWTVTSNQSWLTVYNSSGSGNATKTLTATANPTIEARMATITVSGSGVPDQIITITQDGATPVLNVSASALTISSLSGSTRTFGITSNISWTAESSQNWLTLNSNSGSGNSTITMTATVNPTTSSRSAIVTVSGPGVTSKTIEVTQSGASPKLTVSTNSLTILSLANSTNTFEIAANLSWTLTSNQDWLTPSTLSGTGNETITLTATVNPTTSPRSATVTVSGSGVTSKTITITQEGSQPFLTVSANALTVSAAINSTITFDIASNITWTATNNEVWLTKNTGSGSGNETITLTAAKNPIPATRSATVTVSGSGVNAETIIVTQEAATIGIEDILQDETAIYPNPVNGILYLKMEVAEVTVSIFDMKGNMAYNRQITDNKVNISNLKNGIYTIVIKDKSGSVTRKFVKQ